VLAFEVKRLPSYVDQAFSVPAANGSARERTPDPGPPAASAT
jgi:hypothetical protein